MERITKIRFERADVERKDPKPAVFISYEVTKLKGTDEHTLRCHDEPLPSFVEKLQALSRWVLEICELPSSYRANLEIRGVSFSYAQDVMGATITALKTLTTANAPLVLNTPHLPSSPYSDGGAETALLLPSGCISALNALQDEARRYLAGERLQGDLFAKPTEPAEQELQPA